MALLRLQESSALHCIGSAQQNSHSSKYSIDAPKATYMLEECSSEMWHHDLNIVGSQGIVDVN